MMKNKSITALALLLALISFFNQPVYAAAKEAAASLFLPTTGQAMNGQLGSTKTKIMAGLEVGLVTTTAVLGIAVGGPVVWVAAAPLMANHVWSSADAYTTARRNQREVSAQNLQLAQRNLDLSREQRFEREQEYRSDIRARVQSAGEGQG